MDLREFEAKILAADREDWTVITCWGHASGPSYLDKFEVWTTGKGESSNIQVESQGMVASLKTDLTISFAWGMTHNPDFKEDWANQFTNPLASSSYVDFLYSGVLVYRDIYVSVDGARCKLPLPERELDRQTLKVTRLTVARNRYRFFEMLDGIEQISKFSLYMTRTGIEIVDASWMV